MNTEIELYNEDIKSEFLSNFQEASKIYRRIFQHSTKFEEQLKKDLYNFNMAELKEFLIGLKPITLAASRTNAHVVSSYWDWSVKKGLRKTGVNPLANVDMEYYKQFVTEAKVYLSDDEIREIIDFFDNYQDRAIFELIYIGVSGRSCSEISNLKKKDVDYDNGILHLTNADGSKREFILDEDTKERTLKILDRASNEKEYKKNGTGEVVNNPGNLGDYYNLIKNEYVIRSSDTNVKDVHSPAAKSVIYRRIDNIKEHFGLTKISPKKIARSGMLYMGKQLLERDGVLGEEQLKEIAARYGLKMNYLMYEYVNEDLIKEIYG